MNTDLFDLRGRKALITGGVVSYLLAVRPDLIDVPHRKPGAAAGLGRVVWTGAIASLAVAAFLAPFASEGSDALEATAETLQFAALEQERPAPISEYEVPLPGVDISTGVWHKVSVSLAGVVGTSAVLGIAFVFGRIARLKRAPHEAEASHAG